VKIAYIAAGAGGMYCGSCIHDNALAAALIELGHEVALLPTYTPLRTDEENVSDPRQFYGAINVFLQHKVPLFRHTPKLLDRLLDGRALLGWVSRLGASTDPRGLGDLALEMLRGESGAQSKELDRLVGWLASSYQPDVVVVTNSLLLGLVRQLRNELGVPVVVSLQGEDLFIDQLPEPQRGRVLVEMRRRASDADLFLAPSRYYASHMAAVLHRDPARIGVVPLGINLEGHGNRAPAADDDPVTIGYLARICPDKGLDRLVEAFTTLASAEASRDVRLRIAGYLGPRDRDYWDEQQRRIAGAGLADRVDFLSEIDRAAKLEFLASIDLLCVPTVYQEAKGLFALEAMASGVPVVLPRHGSFPEMVDETGGGVLCDPDSESDLVAALARLIERPDERHVLGQRGRAAVHADRSAAVMARRTADYLNELLHLPEETVA
jgi:glycosyltransferase involved in cell wall biosynthesis